MLARDKALMTRGRLPIQETRIVPWGVFPQTDESLTLTAAAQGANAGVSQAMLQCQEAEMPNMGERRNHQNVVVEWNTNVSRHQTERLRDPERDVSQFAASARSRFNRDDDRALFRTVEAEVDQRLFGEQRRRKILEQTDMNWPRPARGDLIVQLG